MHLAEPLAISEILAWLGPFLLSPEPGDSPPSSQARFESLSSPEKADALSLTFIGPKVSIRMRETLCAGLALVEGGTALGANTGSTFRSNVPVLRVASVAQAMAKLLSLCASRFERELPAGQGGNLIHPSAVMEGILGGDVVVGAFAFVAAGSYIGRGTVLEARATVMAHVRIGEASVIQSGVVIGCSGFGFLPMKENEAVPHLAGVRLDDNVFVGANSVIAAGVLHPTLIGRGCKLDSHVQIAHNVELGPACYLASQSGIAGSTQVGARLRMGGAASVAGHLVLGDDVQVAACSGVTHDLPNGAIVAGFPARPIRAWRKREVWLRREIELGE